MEQKKLTHKSGDNQTKTVQPSISIGNDINVQVRPSLLMTIPVPSNENIKEIVLVA